jgi:hypothetical protein
MEAIPDGPFAGESLTLQANGHSWHFELQIHLFARRLLMRIQQSRAAQGSDEHQSRLLAARQAVPRSRRLWALCGHSIAVDRLPDGHRDGARPTARGEPMLQEQEDGKTSLGSRRVKSYKHWL